MTYFNAETDDVDGLVEDIYNFFINERAKADEDKKGRLAIYYRGKDFVVFPCSSDHTVYEHVSEKATKAHIKDFILKNSHRKKLLEMEGGTYVFLNGGIFDIVDYINHLKIKINYTEKETGKTFPATAIFRQGDDFDIFFQIARENKKMCDFSDNFAIFKD